MNKSLKNAEERAKEALAIARAWQTGRLRYKLDSLQRKVCDQIEACPGGSFYFSKPRRIGGSYLLVVRAVEQCLRKPNSQVRYAAPTAKALRKIVQPNLRKVLADCPTQLRPKWSTLEQEYRFPNGSILSLYGCEHQRYEDMRGTEADEIYLDECGFIDSLDYILDDVLMPQIQDTGGKIVLVSTPPRSPGHPAAKLAEQHMLAGQFFTCTVWDNPRKSKEQHEKFFRRIARGVPLEKFYKTTMFRREYLAELVVDEDSAVVPEWDKDRQERLVKELPRPDMFHAYVGIDLGWRDGTAAVFGYWDFMNARLVIEDEMLVFRKTIEQFQPVIAQKEAEQFPGMKIAKRMCDNEELVCQELNRRGIVVVSAIKKNKELGVNMLRELVRNDSLFINPRCVKLISQLMSTIWNDKRTEFTRNSDGHGDLLDALIYMLRGIPRNRNPYGNSELYDNNVFHAWDKEETKDGTITGALSMHVAGWNN